MFYMPFISLKLMSDRQKPDPSASKIAYHLERTLLLQGVFFRQTALASTESLSDNLTPDSRAAETVIVL